MPPKFVQLWKCNVWKSPPDKGSFSTYKYTQCPKADWILCGTDAAVKRKHETKESMSVNLVSTNRWWCHISTSHAHRQITYNSLLPLRHTNAICINKHPIAKYVQLLCQFDNHSHSQPILNMLLYNSLLLLPPHMGKWTETHECRSWMTV